MTTLALHDALGYAIPFAADFEIEDAVAAILGDIPAAADHDVEPDWDAAFDGPYEPTAEDLADYAEWSAEIERRWLEDRMDRDGYTLEADGYVTDADVMTVLGCAG